MVPTMAGIFAEHIIFEEADTACHVLHAAETGNVPLAAATGLK